MKPWPTFQAYLDTPVYFQKVATDRLGAALLNEDLVGVEIGVFEGDERLDDGSIVGAVLYDTFETGNGWDQGGDGYNFDHTLASDAFFREGGHLYRVEFKLTMNSTSSGPIYFGYYLQIEPILLGVV